MQFEPAFRQPGVERGLDRFRFVLSPAMNQPIIRIPTPWEVTMCPRHPEVERVVHKKVGQDWANHAPYTKGNFRFERTVKGWRTRYPLLDLRLKR